MQLGLETVSWPPAATNKVGVMQQRRKWSDWSECSIECKKTRHRIDCEDLLVSQQNNKNSNSSLASKSNKTQTGQQNGYDELTKRQANKLNAYNEDQLEDEEDGEDYGDVGDDEGITDSCDKVEPSKTYQEIACRGGSCRLASTNKRPTGFPAIHDRLGSHKAVATSTASIRPSVATIQDAAVSPPTMDSVEPQDKEKAQVRSNYTTTARGEQSPTANIWPTATRPMLTTTTTKNMWLSQLSGNLGQDSLAYVVQWAILIGALLTVILLIVLMLRKLFVATLPSYHWMLAKQTIKSGASAYTVADCCHPTTSSLSCPSATSSVVLDPPHRHHQHQHQYPTGHLAPRHYCMDTKGRSHLVTTLAKQQLEDQIYVEPTEVVAAERSSAATTGSSGYRQLLATQFPRPGDFSEGNHSPHPTANYAVGNYDTCDKGFVLTRDFISYPAQDQGRHHHHQHPSFMQQQQTRSIKANVTPTGHQLPSHHSPSSSLSNDGDADNKLNIDLDDDDDDKDERSSGQSTTAQMLSNAASSSFEQPPELESPSQPVSQSSTPKALPASFTHRPRHQQSAKLTNQANSVKSQPNSPMFVNQFHSKQHQNRRHSPRFFTHKRSSSQAPDGVHDYDRPDEQVAQISSGGDVGGSSSLSNNDQNVLKLVRDLEAGHCDNNQDRHYYESLDEHRLSEDQE